MTSDGPHKGSLAFDHACPAPDRSTAPSPFRIDEGFSEETRSQTTSEAAFEPEPIPIERNDLLAHNDSVRQWLLSQPVELRADIVRELLSSLPNLVLSQLVSEANDRLHFDPVRCLPQEIVSFIFELLDPTTLVQASLVSRLWRSHTLEPRLWRLLFGKEGWTHDRAKLHSLESKNRHHVQNLLSTRRGRPRPRDSTPEGSDMKRLRQDAPRQEHRNSRDTSRLWVESSPEEMPSAWAAQSKQTVSGSTSIGQRIYSPMVDPGMDTDETDEEMNDATDEMVAESQDLELGKSETPDCHLLESSNIIDMASETPQPNWHHLYKQRRRLEQNWSAGRFRPFRLPHPDFTKEEAHRQCVYSLQFTATHLVSGSRDKTIRIWDLSTQRLKLPPLVGHHGSVLCLQFDESPQQDVIISGGSDSDVIIWKFSTGDILKRLRYAHTESVLNLRFDDRYLVTCSKDKTIKLWNRRDLKHTDPEYPQVNRSPNAHYPDYIVDIRNLAASQVVNPLAPYTLLMTFDQHNAAVNAIQIYKNEIVSASGDRKIMLWDIRTGTLIRTFLGHSKGIACVQYDGRRIISGSSDNSVRIFDSQTSAQVAVLDGHDHLVRTVQGDFGDLADDGEALEAEARKNDEVIMSSRRQRLQDGQPANWQEPFVYGAKLPQSGGGNRWSKIVSGSYDETVIIWRKNERDRWFPAKQLRQEDVMRATAPPGEGQPLIPIDSFDTATRSGFVRVSSGPQFALLSTPAHIFEQAQALGMPLDASTREGIQWIRRNLLICRTAWGCIQFYRLRFWHLPVNNGQAAPAPLPGQTSPVPHQSSEANDATQIPQTSMFGAQPAHLHPNHPHYQPTPPQAPTGPRVNSQLRQPQLQAQLHHRLAEHLTQSSRDIDLEPGPTNLSNNHISLGQNYLSHNPQQQGVPVQPEPEDQTSDGEVPVQLPQDPSSAHLGGRQVAALLPVQQLASPQQEQQQRQSEQQQPPQQQQQQQPQQQQHHHHHHHHHHQQPQDGGLSRVFKLQFDSRRIICCSQQPIIVGWDFANGDADIEEASQLFDAGV